MTIFYNLDKILLYFTRFFNLKYFKISMQRDEFF